MLPYHTEVPTVTLRVQRSDTETRPSFTQVRVCSQRRVEKEALTHAHSSNSEVPVITTVKCSWTVPAPIYRKQHRNDFWCAYHTMRWSVLGILLLVILIVGILIITCRKKMFAARSCRNKTPSTGMRTKLNNDDVKKQDNMTGQDLVYENISSRKDLDHEEEGCTYSTVRAAQAPSSYAGDVPRDDLTVLYSEVKRSKVQGHI